MYYRSIMDAIAARGITQLYVVGGDGTHRGYVAFRNALAR